MKKMSRRCQEDDREDIKKMMKRIMMRLTVMRMIVIRMIDFISV